MNAATKARGVLDLPTTLDKLLCVKECTMDIDPLPDDDDEPAAEGLGGGLNQGAPEDAQRHRGVRPEQGAEEPAVPSEKTPRPSR